ncbi:MAG TPA: protoporphyrinogen oxidase [Savagea sp.]
MKKIAVIGGGITGLTTAFELEQKIKEGHELAYDLYEASNRLGGKIETIRKDGFLIERGPDSFLARKTALIELAEAVGLKEDLIRNQTGQAYILVNKKLHPIPAGSFMGIPTQLSPFLTTSLFSWSGKMRAAMDLFQKKETETKDVSLGTFFRKRLGNEVVDHLIEPLLSGIYSGDINQMSTQATFPQFQKYGQEYGSIIRGLQKEMPKKKRQTGKQVGQFMAFKNGFQSLVDAIVTHLPAEKIHLNTAVTRIQKMGKGYELLLASGEKRYADEVFITIPHPQLAQLLDDTALAVWNDVPSNSVVNVALAFDAHQVDNPLEGTGFIISRKETNRMTACTWTDQKWSHVASSGKTLLRVYLGKPADQEVTTLPDAALIEIIMQELKELVQVKGQPLFTVVTRYIEAMPQYTVGHLQRLQQLEERLHAHYPGIVVSGSSFYGVGVPDCVLQAQQSVRKRYNMK